MAQPLFKQNYCRICYGQGIKRTKEGRWMKCVCGRELDSKATMKLVKQAALDKRLEDIKKGAW